MLHLFIMLKAYKKWQEVNPNGDLRLPGLGNFTQDQLFFIGHAQVIQYIT